MVTCAYQMCRFYLLGTTATRRDNNVLAFQTSVGVLRRETSLEVFKKTWTTMFRSLTQTRHPNGDKRQEEKRATHGAKQASGNKSVCECTCRLTLLSY